MRLGIINGPVAWLRRVALPILVRQKLGPGGHIIDLTVIVAGVVFWARTGIGLRLPDSRTGSGTLGLEGCFLVLISSLGLLEYADDMPTLLSKEAPGSVIHIEGSAGNLRRANCGFGGVDNP